MGGFLFSPVWSREIFLQTLVDGIAVGSLYALIALGYTLVFGILQFINFAHGDVFALGAWLTWALATGLLRLSVNHAWLANPILLLIIVPLGAILLCALAGFTIERLAYKPLRGAPRLNVLITAIGVSLLLENTGQLHPFNLPGGLNLPFGAQPAGMPGLMPDVKLISWSPSPGAQPLTLSLGDGVIIATAAI